MCPQKKLIERGIFKIDGRHFYECSFDEVALAYRIHSDEYESPMIGDEYGS